MNKNISYKKNRNSSKTLGTIRIEWNTMKIIKLLGTVIQKELNICQEKWELFIKKNEQEVINVINNEGTDFINNILDNIHNSEHMVKVFQEIVSKQYPRKKELDKNAIDILYNGQEYEYIQKAKNEKIITQEILNRYEKTFKKNCKLFNYEIANEMRFSDIYFEVETVRTFNTKYISEYIINKVNNVIGDNIEKKIVEERKKQLINRIRCLMEV